jgi:uncharacterized protein
MMRPILPIFLMALVVPATSATAQRKTGAQDLKKYSGIYAPSRGQFLYLQPWPGGEGKLLLTDERGQLRALSSESENVFSGGPGLLQSAPAEQTITFLVDSKGRIVGLVRRRNGFAKAKKLQSYRSEEVSFRSGDLNLAGTLWTPPGKGPHPAMVLLHGSGRTDRYNALPPVEFLLTHGVALLGYDKRGVGGSAGDWQTASIDDLAGDALAAVQYLARRKEIDPHRIGLFGVSHGGWVAPLTAAQSQDVAFMVSVSGPAASPAEVEMERLASDLGARGFSENDVRDALELLKLGNDVARGKLHWERYQTALDGAKNAAWFPFVAVPLAADSPLLDHWRHTPLDYDPASAIAKLRVPVLALFGALDRNVLPSQNAERWRAALDEGQNRDYTIRIFSQANHMLLEAQTGSEEEIESLRRFVPEYALTLLDWLRKHRFVTR